MKVSKKWLLRFLPGMLIVGVVVGWMVAQQSSVNPLEAQAVWAAQEKPGELLPASAKAPPEMTLKERKRSTVKDLLEKVRKQPGGKDKIEKAEAKKRGKVLSASAKAPPEMQKLELERVLSASAKAPPEMQKLELEKAPKERKRSTVKDLLEKVRKQPGGKDKIEKAKTHGARIGMGSDKTGFSFSRLASLNPFRAEVANAAIADAYSLELTHSSPTSTDPFGRLYYYGALRELHRLYNYNFSITGTQIIKPFAYFYFNLPRTAWYVINVVASPGSEATLMHYDAGWTTVETWDISGTGSQDHPALLDLAAGSHYFLWRLDTGSAYVTTVTIDEPFFTELTTAK